MKLITNSDSSSFQSLSFFFANASSLVEKFLMAKILNYINLSPSIEWIKRDKSATRSIQKWEENHDILFNKIHNIWTIYFPDKKFPKILQIVGKILKYRANRSNCNNGRKRRPRSMESTSTWRNFSTNPLGVHVITWAISNNVTQTVSGREKKIATLISQRCSSYISLSTIWFFANEKRGGGRRGEKREGGYGSIDRELGRYDIIVTNIESILYYCTSIFVIINPNRVTRGEMERGRQRSNEARIKEYVTMGKDEVRKKVEKKKKKKERRVK